MANWLIGAHPCHC